MLNKHIEYTVFVSQPTFLLFQIRTLFAKPGTVFALEKLPQTPVGRSKQIISPKQIKIRI